MPSGPVLRPQLTPSRFHRAMMPVGSPITGPSDSGLRVSRCRPGRTSARCSPRSGPARAAGAARMTTGPAAAGRARRAGRRRTGRWSGPAGRPARCGSPGRRRGEPELVEAGAQAGQQGLVGGEQVDCSAARQGVAPGLAAGGLAAEVTAEHLRSRSGPAGPSSPPPRSRWAGRRKAGGRFRRGTAARSAGRTPAGGVVA